MGLTLCFNMGKSLPREEIIRIVYYVLSLHSAMLSTIAHGLNCILDSLFGFSSALQQHISRSSRNLRVRFFAVLIISNIIFVNSKYSKINVLFNCSYRSTWIFTRFYFFHHIFHFFPSFLSVCFSVELVSFPVWFSEEIENILLKWRFPSTLTSLSRHFPHFHRRYNFSLCFCLSLFHYLTKRVERVKVRDSLLLTDTHFSKNFLVLFLDSIIPDDQWSDFIYIRDRSLPHLHASLTLIILRVHTSPWIFW